MKRERWRDIEEEREGEETEPHGETELCLSRWVTQKEPLGARGDHGALRSRRTTQTIIIRAAVKERIAAQTRNTKTRKRSE